MNILFLYNSTQTYTNTVFEHIASFSTRSKHQTFFCHIDQESEVNIDTSRFDAIGIHYTIRLPFNQLSPSVISVIEKFSGCKFLFIQDEYDHTYRTWHWIKKLGLNLIFTVVPQTGIEHIYPKKEFPNSRFINNLTGYVPENFDKDASLPPPSKRSILIGYRGRPLPIRYGKLGIEKVDIGKITKTYCNTYNITTDIEWSEAARIYGDKWYDFMTSCRAMLGSESGSNVFDWDNSINQEIEEFKQKNKSANDADIYDKIIKSKDIDGLMNQVSPRIFEAIAARTILVLFEGNYSEIIQPNIHFIPLKKDGSNLPDIVSLLQDDVYVDEMAERAYRDIIESGKYSYKSFVNTFDHEIECSIREQPSHKNSYFLVEHAIRDISEKPSAITTFPIRSTPPPQMTDSCQVTCSWMMKSAVFAWSKLPTCIRDKIKPVLKPLLVRGSS